MVRCVNAIRGVDVVFKPEGGRSHCQGHVRFHWVPGGLPLVDSRWVNDPRGVPPPPRGFPMMMIAMTMSMTQPPLLGEFTAPFPAITHSLPLIRACPLLYPLRCAIDSILLPTTKKFSINVMENAWVHKFKDWGNKVGKGESEGGVSPQWHLVESD